MANLLTKANFLFLLSLFFMFSELSAQGKKLDVEGQVSLEVGNVSGAKVTIEKSGRNVGTVNVGSDGRFELNLDFDGDYTITISQAGFVPVKYRMLTNASADAKEDGLMPFSMPAFLVQNYPGAPDGSKVLSTIKFDETLYDFAFDKAEYKSLSSQKKMALAAKEKALAEAKAKEADELKAKQEAIAKRYAEEEAARKKAMEEEERLRKEKELNDKYDAAITKADKAFAQAEWEFAKQNYQEAATLKPAEAYPKTKLTEIENRMANEKKYAAAIEKGDKAMTAKDFNAAKMAFSEALSVKNNDAVAKAKLAEAEAAIAEAVKQKELDAKYANQIAAADKLFVAKKWADAKASYNEALKLKPDESHPKERIAEAEKMIAEEEAKKAAEKELNDKYNAAVAKADKFFTEKKWTEAKESYSEASSLKPAESLPKNKIKEIEAIEKAEADKIAKEKELNEKYAAAISKADGLFQEKKLAEAKTFYNEALGYKSTENYPKTKIKEIDDLVAAENKRIAEEKALNDKYNAALTKGAAALSAKKYGEAKTAYSEAANLKPDEELPKTKIKEIDELIAKDEEAKAAEKALNEQYNAVIKKADTDFGNKNYKDAKQGYNQALTLKPSETYPSTKLKEIAAAEKAEADRIAKEQETDAKYREAISQADNAFSNADWNSAKSLYTQAGKLKPDEKYPKDKLAEIDNKLKYEAEHKAAAAALDKKYNDAIALGDKQLAAKKYNEAKAAFSEASTLKPEESLPKQKLEQINKLIAEQAEQERLKAEEEARKAAEEAARKKAEEEARLAKEAEERKKAQEEAEALAKKKAEEAAEAKRKAEEEAARKEAELAAQKAREAEAARIKAEQEAARLAAEEEARIKALAEKEAAARKKAEEEAARLAAEEEARIKALAEKEAAARKKAEEEAARLAAEDAERLRKLAEEKARKDAENAQRQAEYEREQARLAAERKKQTEEALRQKAEAEKQKTLNVATGIVPRREGPFVVLYKYSHSTENVYGYINMGDGTGSREISESEYKMLQEKYKEYIRNIFN
jgi:hypothetical protein